jgi:hypothetical protein
MQEYFMLVHIQHSVITAYPQANWLPPYAPLPAVSGLRVARSRETCVHAHARVGLHLRADLHSRVGLHLRVGLHSRADLHSSVGMHLR